MHEKIESLNESIKELSENNSFQNAKTAVNSVIRLLGIEDEPQWRTFTDSNGRIISNGSWLKKAEGFADRRGAYKLNVDEKYSLDLKAYWTQKKIDKSKISMLVALTPNFEDEPYYSSKLVGIDFIIPEEPDRIVIVLSKNYIIRTVELKDFLSETQKEILTKWLKITDFSNKSQLHEILWQSFDLESVNKQFYKGICTFFTELKQHLVSEKTFDSRHAAYFTNRLIGRIVFCRFLDKKGIIDRGRKYFDTEGKQSTEYYREKLESLFFKVFNTPIEDRESGADDKTPFLNGGLFEIKENDKYKDNKLTFPTDYFTRLFEFLKHYNFTTDESTSAFQQVAIDPEMLGKIFENLLAEQVEETGEQARKAKGAFYTPREIVDYMCKESLREYLKTQVKEARDRDDKISLLLDTKPHLWRDQQRNYQKDIEPFKIQIFDALDKVKILDPACGSGAFPMGMMQLLLMCYERLEPRFEAYKTKLNIIKNNIYGVDIEPMAVEISRLRAWLSIIVDKEGDIRKIEPLPNLDFKFVCANSLIPLDKSGQMNLIDDTDLEEKITALRDKYYDEKTVKGKNSLRKEFEELIHAKETGLGKSKKQEQLESYHPFDSENISQFFDPEFMFSLTGFDIVIGNPPYGIVFNTELKKEYTTVYSTFKRNNDIFVAFFQNADFALKNNGIVSFITPNTYRNGDYFQALRTFFVKNFEFNKLLDFKNTKIFADPTVFVSIAFLKKTKIEKQNISISEVESFIPKLESKEFSICFEAKEYDNIKLIEKDEILSKIYEKNKVVTLDSCFLIKDVGFNYWTEGKGKKRDGDSIGSRILYSGIQENNMDTPFIKGKNINKYHIEKPNNYLKHNYKSFLDPTKDTFRFTKELFEESPKIVYRQTASNIIAALDSNKSYLDKTVHIVVNKQKDTLTDLKYVLSLLNSKLYSYLYTNISQEEEGRTFAQVKTTYIKKLPIKVIPTSVQLHYTNIVDKILEMKKDNHVTDTTELENQIDILVYKLYELTYDEVKIIDPEIEKIISQADYEKMEIE